jgi:hypothetical protein
MRQDKTQQGHRMMLMRALEASPFLSTVEFPSAPCGLY